MFPDCSDLVAEEMNDWMDLNKMRFTIPYSFYNIPLQTFSNKETSF